MGQGANPDKDFGINKVCGGLIYTPMPVAACAPSVATYACIVPAPVLTRARWPSIRALTLVRMAVAMCVPTPVHARSRWSCPLPFSNEEFASGPTHPRPFPPVSARHIRASPTHLRPSPPISARRVRASHICPRPFPPIIARRVHASTSGRTPPTKIATCASPQGLPVSAPSTRACPRMYINPFAPPH
jgi:hypothetical protein